MVDVLNTWQIALIKHVFPKFLTPLRADLTRSGALLPSPLYLAPPPEFLLVLVPKNLPSLDSVHLGNLLILMSIGVVFLISSKYKVVSFSVLVGRGEMKSFSEFPRIFSEFPRIFSDFSIYLQLLLLTALSSLEFCRFSFIVAVVLSGCLYHELHDSLVDTGDWYERPS